MLSDSIRGKSGVGTMANNIVLNSVDQLDWFHVAPEQTTISELQKLDLSMDVRKFSGVRDANVHIVPYHSYGDIDLLRMIIHQEKIDAIFMFTDPRYWEWLFEHERELRQYVPIVYYNIWDNYPVPYYNKSYYESVDSLIAISKVTEEINRAIIKDSQYKPTIEYIPHGIDETLFYPITSESPEYADLVEFREKSVGDAEYVILYNSRNIDRKNPLDVIHTFTKFLEEMESYSGNVDTSKIKLLMHTDIDDPAGNDLAIYIKHQIPVKYKYNIIFSRSKLDNKQMNLLYNVSNVTIALSSNEGWGLSITESIMAGKPVIAPNTGGFKDQMYIENGWSGPWAFPIQIAARNLIGSRQTPYIYADRVNDQDVVDALIECWASKSFLGITSEHGREFLIKNKMTTKDMAKSITKNILNTIENFEVRSDFDLVKL